jgi:hypothetical protein
MEQHGRHDAAATPGTRLCIARVHGLRARRVPNQRVDLCGLDLIHAAHRVGDLTLVRARVDDEDKGVVVLDLLHRGLGGEGVLEDGVLVERVGARHRFARVLRRTQQPQCLRPVELGLVPLVDRLLASSAGKRLGRLLGLVGLLA